MHWNVYLRDKSKSMERVILDVFIVQLVFFETVLHIAFYSSGGLLWCDFYGMFCFYFFIFQTNEKKKKKKNALRTPKKWISMFVLLLLFWDGFHLQSGPFPLLRSLFHGLNSAGSPYSSPLNSVSNLLIYWLCLTWDGLQGCVNSSGCLDSLYIFCFRCQILLTFVTPPVASIELSESSLTSKCSHEPGPATRWCKEYSSKKYHRTDVMFLPSSREGCCRGAG